MMSFTEVDLSLSNLILNLQTFLAASCLVKSIFNFNHSYF
jgi:hypothetical protein